MSSRDYLFAFSIVVRDREFPITFYPDGSSEWQDFTFQKRLTSEADTRDFVGALFGDAKSAQRHSDREHEFTVDAQLPEPLLQKIREAAAKFGADLLTIADEQELDSHLLPFFWSDVNHQLSEPLDPKA
ncbi:MAG: hypothetical protein P1U89_18260 [Verrucomicrobiales bacterium]|nr:hypothetical protein [Verrucomicrobiales bacterium]